MFNNNKQQDQTVTTPFIGNRDTTGKHFLTKIASSNDKMLLADRSKMTALLAQDVDESDTNKNG